MNLNNLQAIANVCTIVLSMPAVVALLTARPWLSIRIRTMDYHNKRLAVVASLLASHRGTLEPGEVTALENEVKFIGREVVASSLRFEHDRVLAWHRQGWQKRFFTVPRPESVADWVATALFYLYAFLGLAYIVLFLPVSFMNPQEFPSGLVILACAVSLGTSALCRHWCLWNAARRVTDAKARAVAAQGADSHGEASPTAASTEIMAS